MTPEENVVTEVAPSVFQAVLWCPPADLLRELLDPALPFVLCWEHRVGRYAWESFQLPVVAPTDTEAVLSRMVTYDFVLPTARFVELLPGLRPAIRAVQLRRIPPDFLDLGRIHGAERYRLLGECGWHVLLDTPANDFGVVCSPNREVVESAIRFHASARGTRAV